MATPHRRSAPVPIDAVLFDFHSTLVDQGDSSAWVQLAWEHAGRTGSHVDVLGAEKALALARALDVVWESAREVDPTSRRDLDPAAHREVWDQVVGELGSVDDDLARALYETVIDPWIPYEDAVPVLRELHDRGVRTGLVSNVAVDVRPVLERGGLSGLLDAVVLSFEAGAVKPDIAIFTEALAALGVPAERALMVGDSWQDDAGAARLGIRTLLLPRTPGPTHGLGVVVGLVDGSRPPTG
jgi:HAD superfamily hydrolase (TIGR01509 family)